MDIKGFLRKNFQVFADLVDQVAQAESLAAKKNSSVGNRASTGAQDEKENVLPQTDNVPPPAQQQNANVNFYLNKIKELEERSEHLTKDNQALKESNKKLKDEVSKKDFFREYEQYCKEVEGLRKQNQALSDTIKKLQSSQK